MKWIFDPRFFGQLILCAFKHLIGLFAMIYTSVLLSYAEILEIISEQKWWKKKKSIPMLRFTRNHETMTMVMHSVALKTFFADFLFFVTLFFCLRVRCDVGKPEFNKWSYFGDHISKWFNSDKTNSILTNNITNTTNNVLKLTQLWFTNAMSIQPTLRHYK